MREVGIVVRGSEIRNMLDAAKIVSMVMTSAGAG